MKVIIVSKFRRWLNSILKKDEPDFFCYGGSSIILGSSKKNQNYYRDLALAKSSRGVFFTEKYFEKTADYSIKSLLSFAERPRFIFINYSDAYTHCLTGLNDLRAPIFAFVGDHYNFTDVSPAAVRKQDFFKKIKPAALVTAYPATNSIVAESLDRPEIPFLYLPWAIDVGTFKDLALKRKYDIACMGALTEKKYPFRRKVRFWLEDQKILRLFRKKRVKGVRGSDHDGDAFNQALNRVRAAFTCSSSMHYLLMKYFEIPAAGALLFAERHPEFESLGFVDGVHYVAVSSDNYQDKMIFYLKGPGQNEASKIARSGYEFVRSNHTWEKRVIKFLAELERIIHVNQKSS